MPEILTPEPPAAPGRPPAPPASPARRGVKAGGLTGALVALALLLVLNFFFTEHFFQIELRDGRLFGSLIDVLNRGVPVFLVALGMTLVIATGGIDLSVGSVVAISGAVAATLIARPPDALLAGLDVHGSLPAVLALALGAALLAGAWNGLLVAWINIQPIVATLILMVAGRGLAQLITNGQIPTFEHPGFEFLGSGFQLGLPFPILIAAAALLVTLLLTRATALGLFIEAVGNNPTASRYVGINARFVKLMAYGFCGLFAGVAGLILTADVKAADVNNAGLYMELDAILAVSVGGTSMAGGRFSLAGTLVGALLIQALTTTILTHGFPPALMLVVKAVVVIVVCLLQSGPFRAIVARHLARRRAEA